ncbi:MULTISPECIES: nucleoside hydrolase [unclassified Leptolyngbya]|uniref:nucleoside hydrolase n=1 Tax=unclassified Leptolyngbya TaxID=2650499 RepID=UPI0016850D89|nr:MULTISPECIES: nucleoside hydrolase [unclassified Leptolyngbya]MBD1913956.1 nucleoside hydrolase [Leptolyngbya sp. FACHB-8]MBD2155923.1 nucleoside hydrolase [Leptolyngbya sp. FACHB-16]
MQLDKPKIILDTDPGGDDSFALLWLQSLAKQGLADIVAVTASAGNVNARNTFLGASKLLVAGGFDAVEVGRGVGQPGAEIEDAAHIHGADGMGNLSHTLPEVSQSFETARPSDEVLIEKLNQMPGEITIVAIAPLTNLAAAEQKSPGILKNAKEIVIMGGAFQTWGNVTPEAEFNIAFDPEAANVVLNSRDDLVVIPLDVTHHLIFTPEMARQVSQVNPQNKISQFIVPLCEFMTSTALAYRETKGVSGFLVHDAATLAYLFYPEMLHFQRAKVEIEMQGTWTRGKTLFDRRHSAKQSANAWVALQTRSVDLLAVMVEDLKKLVQD